MTIQRIAHVCIFTSDLDATERFYVQGLGLSRGFEFVKEGRRIGFYLGAGGQTFIEVFHRDPPVTRREEHPLSHFCLEVEDLDAVIERLKSHGIACTDKLLGADHSWQAWLTDPSGVRLELHAYTDQSCQLTGAACRVNW